MWKIYSGGYSRNSRFWSSVTPEGILFGTKEYKIRYCLCNSEADASAAIELYLFRYEKAHEELRKKKQEQNLYSDV